MQITRPTCYAIIVLRKSCLRLLLLNKARIKSQDEKWHMLFVCLYAAETRGSCC